MVSQKSRPRSPGALLRDHFLTGSVTQDAFARALGVSRYSVNQIVNERRSITAEMAVRLGHVTSTSPEFWLNLQRDVDLYEARQDLAAELDRLTVLRAKKPESDLIQMDGEF